MRHTRKSETPSVRGKGFQCKPNSTAHILHRLARVVRFIELVLTLRSVTSARWVQDYESARGIEGQTS